ncbi:MAG TPA: IMP cyclohydrolase [Candidatus Paceibacterota bacterium]|nr:MAG: hypothetical protein B7X03_02180 [Parcubacteria group bacterium 21-58-10]HQT82770.1 IMP cyclohydrolase [Candidatus Paceibacterota bacterium]
MKKSIVPAGVLSAAESNLSELRKNLYPGRLIIAGLNDSGKCLIQVYAILGRSENSRNRVLEADEGRLFTETADPSKVKDPSLIIYNAMDETLMPDDTAAYVVSNGHQTDHVRQAYFNGETFNGAMQSSEPEPGKQNVTEYEPDKPNFTPRITAVSSWVKGKPRIEMGILRKSPWSDACDRHLYEMNDMGKGFGYCLTTYMGDGDPLPAFQGEPYLLPLGGDANFIAGTYWDALNADNRVSLAVKFIPKEGPPEIVIINKYSKVASST